MQDLQIISAVISSRVAFEQIAAHVDKTEFSPLTAPIWTLVEEYYAIDADAQIADVEVLRGRLRASVEEKHQATLVSHLDSMPEVSSANIVHDLLTLKRERKGMELASAITGNAAQQKEAGKLLREYTELLAQNSFETSDTIYAAGLDSIDEVLGIDNQIPLVPKALNERIGGGVVAGDFIIVFARPEIGKTLFCVAQVANFLRQKKKVLYIGNEDKIDKIKARIRNNLSNMTRSEVAEFTEEANKRAIAKNIESHLVAVHLHPGSVSEIESLVIEHQPDVLVIDQLRNVAGEGKNMSSKLNQIAIDVRQLLSKHNLVGLAIAQANAGEHGKTKVWLEAGDVDESRTGIPAQADLLLGIGADNDMLIGGNRAISFCKNKLTGNHEGLIIGVDEFRSKVS